MSAYYSTLNNSNGNINPGNFGILNTTRLGLLSNSGYTSGINNAGLVPPQVSPVVSTNVIQGLYTNNIFNNVGATGTTNFSAQSGLNNNSQIARTNQTVNNLIGSGPVIAPGSGINGITGYA
jgi:hypothetical protein